MAVQVTSNNYLHLFIYYTQPIEKTQVIFRRSDQSYFNSELKYISCCNGAIQCLNKNLDFSGKGKYRIRIIIHAMSFTSTRNHCICASATNHNLPTVFILGLLSQVVFSWQYPPPPPLPLPPKIQSLTPSWTRLTTQSTNITLATSTNHWGTQHAESLHS